MKVTVSMNRMGHLTLAPVSRAINGRLHSYLEQVGMPDPDPSVYIQLDYEVESFLDDLRPEVARDIREGWTRTIIMDPHTYGAYVGYDAGDNCAQWIGGKR